MLILRNREKVNYDGRRQAVACVLASFLPTCFSLLQHQQNTLGLITTILTSQHPLEKLFREYTSTQLQTHINMSSESYDSSSDFDDADYSLQSIDIPMRTPPRAASPLPSPLKTLFSPKAANAAEDGVARLHHAWQCTSCDALHFREDDASFTPLLCGEMMLNGKVWDAECGSTEFRIRAVKITGDGKRKHVEVLPSARDVVIKNGEVVEVKWMSPGGEPTGVGHAEEPRGRAGPKQSTIQDHATVRVQSARDQSMYRSMHTPPAPASSWNDAELEASSSQLPEHVWKNSGRRRNRLRRIRISLPGLAGSTVAAETQTAPTITRYDSVMGLGDAAGQTRGSKDTSTAGQPSGLQRGTSAPRSFKIVDHTGRGYATCTQPASTSPTDDTVAALGEQSGVYPVYRQPEPGAIWGGIIMPTVSNGSERRIAAPNGYAGDESDGPFDMFAPASPFLRSPPEQRGDDQEAPDPRNKRSPKQQRSMASVCGKGTKNQSPVKQGRKLDTTPKRQASVQAGPSSAKRAFGTDLSHNVVSSPALETTKSTGKTKKVARRQSKELDRTRTEKSERGCREDEIRAANDAVLAYFTSDLAGTTSPTDCTGSGGMWAAIHELQMTADRLLDNAQTARGTGKMSAKSADASSHAPSAQADPWTCRVSRVALEGVTSWLGTVSRPVDSAIQDKPSPVWNGELSRAIQFQATGNGDEYIMSRSHGADAPGGTHAQVRSASESGEIVEMAQLQWESEEVSEVLEDSGASKSRADGPDGQSGEWEVVAKRGL